MYPNIVNSLFQTNVLVFPNYIINFTDVTMIPIVSKTSLSHFISTNGAICADEFMPTNAKGKYILLISTVLLGRNCEVIAR